METLKLVPHVQWLWWCAADVATFERVLIALTATRVSVTETRYKGRAAPNLTLIILESVCACACARAGGRCGRWRTLVLFFYIFALVSTSVFGSRGSLAQRLTISGWKEMGRREGEGIAECSEGRGHLWPPSHRLGRLEHLSPATRVLCPSVGAVTDASFTLSRSR